MLSGLTLYFKDNVDKAKECSLCVLDNREDITKVALKRTVNKNVRPQIN